MHRRVTRLAAVLLLAPLLVSCKRSSQSSANVPELPPEYELELQPLTPLSPNRPTHIAIDTLGNLAFVQESPAGDDTVFVMGEGAIPRTSSLTSARILGALSAGGGTGNIQSLAPGRNGQLYFYFQGSRGRKLVACLGTYSIKKDAVKILADTDAMMSLSRFGRSLALARGSILVNSTNVWLWLRHSDDSVLFRARYVDVPEITPRMLEDGRLNITIQGHSVDLNDADFALAPAAGDDLNWLDLSGMMMHQIDSTGEVAPIRALVGLPIALSLPVRDEQGRMLVFAGDSPPMTADPESGATAPPPLRLRVKYPAILIFDQREIITIGRESFNTYAGLDLDKLRLSELIADRRNQGWIGYDLSSGDLLRLKIREKGSNPKLELPGG